MSDGAPDTGAGQGVGDVPARRADLQGPAESPAPQPPPTDGGTLYDQALALQEQKQGREEMTRALTARGHDAESVAVVLNALPGATPENRLVELRIDQSVNPIAPGLLSITEMGMEGEPRTVALYWFTFGLTLNILTFAVTVVGETEILDSTSSDWARFAFPVIPWIGFPLGIAAIIRAVRLLMGRR